MNYSTAQRANDTPSDTAVRVVVADDSYYVQKYVKEWLELDGNISVIATAADGVDVVRKVMQLRPELVFLDIRMPKLDGLAALQQIMRSYPTPVIIYCEHEETPARDQRLREKAMELGALEMIFKPQGDEILNDDGSLGANLRQRTRVLSKIKVVRLLQGRGGDGDDSPILTPPPSAIMRSVNSSSRVAASEMVDFAMRSDAEVRGTAGEKKIVLIGASTGGPDALRVVLSRLPETFPYPIVIAQHMPRGFTTDFARQLSRTASLPVTEASENDVIRPGHAYVAPGNFNLELRGQSGFTLTPISDASNHTPSIDTLFRSGAIRFKNGVVAVVLTGMGNDGELGVRAVKSAGGVVIAQDEKTSSIFGMPRCAIETGCADVISPIQDVAQWIVHHTCRRVGVEA